MKYYFKPVLQNTIFGVVFLVSLFSPLDVSGFKADFSKQEKVIITNAVGLGVITAWGVLNWDYFKNDPHMAKEGWFERNSDHGGADKLGHFYFSYTFSHILAAFYENSGYSTRQSARLGSLSSFAMVSWMEIGDSFSSYGFSHEDFIMNLIGTATGYLFYTRPFLSEKIDFRIEYLPEFDKTDFTTDYEHQKMIMALKFDGFDFTRDTRLKHLEIHLGYYTRGYPDKQDRERRIYLGIGINIPRIFNQYSMPKTSKLFSYVQMPWTYIKADSDLNK
ncbi:MAG: DUF2279 domain-containing protein [Desulfobacterium sp.]|jgi:uncharacterized protein YfiM (DUF2279 family)|nr:DUF2279 domain-containing protein [Desulfobacterium sp.]